MAYWLLKTEPSEYSWVDLVREKRAVWDGIANPVALKNLRSMKAGDLALVYHTGKERQAVGVARVVTPSPDAAAVVIEPVEPLASPVPLAAIKADRAFAGWDLLRMPRLSVAPVPPAMWDRLLAMARK